jgi:hypothetical protein
VLAHIKPTYNTKPEEQQKAKQHRQSAHRWYSPAHAQQHLRKFQPNLTNAVASLNLDLDTMAASGAHKCCVHAMYVPVPAQAPVFNLGALISGRQSRKLQAEVEAEATAQRQGPPRQPQVCRLQTAVTNRPAT